MYGSPKLAYINIITQFRPFQFYHSIFGFAFICCDVFVLSQSFGWLKKKKEGSEAGQVSHSIAFQLYTPTTTKRVWLLYLRLYYCVPTSLSFAFLTSPFRSPRFWHAQKSRIPKETKKNPQSIITLRFHAYRMNMAGSIDTSFLVYAVHTVRTILAHLPSETINLNLWPFIRS